MAVQARPSSRKAVQGRPSSMGPSERVLPHLTRTSLFLSLLPSPHSPPPPPPPPLSVHTPPPPRPPQGRDGMLAAARDLAALGPTWVLLKGGHSASGGGGGGGDEDAEDVLLHAATGRAHLLAARRLPARNSHGTGCTLASAIAAGLAAGLPTLEVVVVVGVGVGVGVVERERASLTHSSPPPCRRCAAPSAMSGTASPPAPTSASAAAFRAPSTTRSGSLRVVASHFVCRPGRCASIWAGAHRASGAHSSVCRSRAGAAESVCFCAGVFLRARARSRM
jgi:hypothetical protein